MKEKEQMEELADELAFFIQETGRRLSEYQEGAVSEYYVLKTAEMASERYDDLTSSIDELIEYNESTNFVDEISQSLSKAGYSYTEEFIAGKDPMSASLEKSRNQVAESLGDEDYPETERAFQKIQDFNYLVRDLEMKYDMDTPKPDLGKEGEEAIEIMEEASKMIENGASSETALDDISPL